jgi:hypothetical protein
MPRIRSFAPVLIAAAAGLAFPAVANADVETDIVNTSCSAEQIEAALQQTSPIAYGFLTSDPQRGNRRAALEIPLPARSGPQSHAAQAFGGWQADHVGHADQPAVRPCHAAGPEQLRTVLSRQA